MLLYSALVDFCASGLLQNWSPRNVNLHFNRLLAEEDASVLGDHTRGGLLGWLQFIDEYPGPVADHEESAMFDVLASTLTLLCGDSRTAELDLRYLQIWLRSLTFQGTFPGILKDVDDAKVAEARSVTFRTKLSESFYKLKSESKKIAGRGHEPNASG